MKIPKTNNRVLAVDPGYDRLGLAVVEGDPSRPQLVWSGSALPPKGAREERLSRVFLETKRAIETYAPDILAIEKLFFSTNVKTALGVAEARGAVLVAAGNAALPVVEYSPQEVKLAVTGDGRADKRAVARMVPKLLALPPKTKRLDDEFDAIALAIAALSSRFPRA